MDGGALTNQGIHYLDALLYLAGDVDHVFASTATELVSVEVEDTGVATLRFANGAIGTVEMTTAARPDDIAASITLLGERGTCVVAGLAANKLQTWSVDPSLCEAASEEIPNAYGFGHKPFIADVVADLLDGVPHPISLAEGTRAIRFLNALYRSAEDRVPVKLADNLTSRNLGRYDAKLHALYTTPEPEAAKISA
jgi:predicted dehydrogenase